MTRTDPPPRRNDPAAVVAGYLNFSAGAFEPAAWRGMNELFAEVEPATQAGVGERPDAAARVAATLGLRLAELEATQPAFRDARQARRMLSLLFDDLLPAYRRHHADLLAHQPPAAIERPYFVMAAAAAVLAEAAAGDAAPEDDTGPLVARALDRLNDYVGWRPVAVLENGRLSAPYPHERVRPIPLFVADAGPAHGRYRDLVAGALEILATAPDHLLRRADFELDALEELAVDPRAFDFMHPAASRPNYLFGLWDPARIDEQGRYRRMVVQQATLDGILSWPAAAGGDAAAGREGELRRESAAVLAGVMLMASGLSGHGPGAAHAALGLGDLLPRIAGYRDDFYRWLLTTLSAGHRARLEEEAARLRQPFGGVRRHINATLAGLRARQVEHVSLSAVMARLGRNAAAESLAAEVPAASARLFARITGRVVAARQSLARSGDAGGAIRELDAAADLLLRAVDCGATVDPWNILGLAGQFPLHEPSGESLPDPRVDDLVATTGAILDGYAAAWRKAGLEGDAASATAVQAAAQRLADWWDHYATTAVSGVPHLSGRECIDSAKEVLETLGRRRSMAPVAPPPGFWRQAVAGFSSPRSHAQAAEALLDEGDLDGAAGLLIHWASLLEGPAVERTGPVWLAAAGRWLALATTDTEPAARVRVRRFLELVEANTSGVVDLLEAASVGREPGAGADVSRPEADADDETADTEERLAAAYESMVWQDSADDGVDGGMLDVEQPGMASPSAAAAIEEAAEFLTGVLRLYRSTVTTWCRTDARAGPPPDRETIDAVIGWRHSIRRLGRTLVRGALAVACRDPDPPPGMSPAEFDKLRWQRDAAAERLVDAAVQAEETRWALSAWLHVARRPPPRETSAPRATVGRLLAAAARGDVSQVRTWLPAVLQRLAGKPVLYIPLSRGGRADRVVRARCRERLLERLATVLPRLGLVEETVGVVRLAKSLESRRPAGAASVSEFDRVFEAATMALVERIVESAGPPPVDHDDSAPDQATERILDGLSHLVPRLLETWLTHARQLRLSVLERVRDDKAFAATREFIERYGTGLFTQHLLAPMSLRGILRGGVRPYLERLVSRLEAEPDDGTGRDRGPVRLATDLASGVLPMRQAAARIRLVLESVAENHAEYRDWNSTTTQSDRGEYLHILLDHLRLKAEYERIAWTLRPVNMAHRVLARRGAVAAAVAWRGRMRDETLDTARGLVERLAALEQRWGIRLASIGDRVRRPFTAVLEQDELEALVPSAVAELTTGKPEGAAAALETKARSFLGVASGSGIEVPDWLDRLSAAVDTSLQRADVAAASGPHPGSESFADAVAWLPLEWTTLRAALEG